MTAFATLGEQRVTAADLTMPLYGLASGAVSLATAAAPAARSTLTIGNLSMAVAVDLQGPFAGLRRARVVQGAGGWRQRVKARSYASPVGLSLDVLLRDAALEVGERITAPRTGIGRTMYMRAARPASYVLGLLAGPMWWMDLDGLTRVGARPTTLIKTLFSVEDYDPAMSRFSIATEDLASWLPGATFTASTVPELQAVTSVSIRFRNEGVLRLDVLTVPAPLAPIGNTSVGFGSGAQASAR